MSAKPLEQQAVPGDRLRAEEVTIGYDARVISQGLSVAIPQGFYGRVAPRSGLAIEHGLDVLAGVIDSDYRGELMCALANHGDVAIEIEAGMRMAQLVIEAIITPEPVWSEDLSATERGAGGLGSTGKT